MSSDVPSADPIRDWKSLERFEVLFGLRFLTCSCYGRLPLFDRDWVTQEFVSALVRTRQRHGFALLAWVLMPEHFHLLLVPRLPESPVDAVLNMQKSTMSRRVLARWRTSKEAILDNLGDRNGTLHFWQPGGGYDRNLRGDRPVAEIVRYVHDNPVRRGLVAAPIDWPWSSARWHAGLTDGQVPMDDISAFRAAEAARLSAMFGSLSDAAKAMKARFGVL